MEWTKEFRRDVVEWDTVNWSRAIDFWNVDGLLAAGASRVLDLGARGGGLSLLFAQRAASNDIKVVCSDLTEPSKTAGSLHQKYGVTDRISYAAVDATKISESEAYDVICFKSVLGGVGYQDNKEAQRIAIQNCYRALKPGGHLVFAENLVASPLHQALRKRFNAWTYWRYVTVDEVQEFCRDFSKVDYRCYGFLGTFGRSVGQRDLLGRVDTCFDRLLPERAKYIISVVAEK